MTAQTPSPRSAKRDGSELFYWRDFLCMNPAAYLSFLEWIDEQKHAITERLADPHVDLALIPTLRGEYAAMKRFEQIVRAPIQEEEAKNAFKARAQGAERVTRTRDSGERRAGGIRFRE